MDPLLEGVIAAAQPCSLALLLPAAGATVLAGRRGWLVATACITGAILATRGRASGLLPWLDPSSAGVIGPALAVVAVVGTILLWQASRKDLDPDRNAQTHAAGADAFRVGAGGAAVGVAAGLIWQPCVGPALGTVLSRLPDDPVGQLLPFAGYIAGLLLAVVALAALPHLHPAVARRLGAVPVRVAAALPLVALAVVLVTGSHTQVIGALVRISSP
ncbi:MAG: hypothetical protein ABGZ36_07360 [Actinomycetota bacterium]